MIESIILLIVCVDKGGMDFNLIGEQHISRRRKPSPLNTVKHKKNTFKSGFVQHVKQRPCHTRLRRTSKAAAVHLKNPLDAMFSFARRSREKGTAAFVQEQVRRIRRGASPRAGEPKRRSAGFSIPIPSFMTLAVIGGTLLVSLAALNWDGLTVSVPLAQTVLPVPQPDTAQVERNLAGYAMPLFAETLPPALPYLAAVPSQSPANSPVDTPLTEGEEIPLDLLETFSWTSYQVKKGDSVSKIAVHFAISIDAIIASNNIPNAKRLPEGKVLRIPNMDGIPYTVKKGDNLVKISKSMGVPLNAILDANDIRSDYINAGETLFIPGAKMPPAALKLALGEMMVYPVRGRLTSPYGWRNDPISGVRRFHAAIDLAAGTGMTVKTAMDGKVATVGFNPTFGKFIIVSHDDGYQSMYAHLSAVSVKQGDYISQGSKIGEVGNTGYSTGSHLHFAVYRHGRAINPLELLN
jgi:murein DD-endopeptidase MepM/ murein hydrolase activator NlpD